MELEKRNPRKRFNSIDIIAFILSEGQLVFQLYLHQEKLLSLLGMILVWLPITTPSVVEVLIRRNMVGLIYFCSFKRFWCI